MKKNIIYTLSLLLISLFLLGNGCNEGREKEQAQKNEQDTIESDTIVSEEPGESINTLPPDNEEDTLVIEQPSDDSLFISLRKTACFGRCPIYEFKVFEGGWTMYYGERFVDKKGYFSAMLSDEELSQIRDSIEATGFFKLHDEYPGDTIQISDVPSTITYIRLDGRTKKIVNKHFHSPAKLDQLETFLDKFLKRKEWSVIKVKN